MTRSFCRSGTLARVIWPQGFRVFHEASIKGKAHLRLQWRRIHSQALGTVVRIRFLVRCWNSAPCQMLPGGHTQVFVSWGAA